MQVLSLSLLLCIAWRSQASSSELIGAGEFIGADGKEHAEHHNPQSVERSILERFVGLRHHPSSAVVSQHPAVQHGLHMLNHRVNRVGPLTHKNLQPFGMDIRNMTLNSNFSDEALASPIAAHAVAGAKSSKGWDAILMARGKMCITMGKKHDMDFEKNKGKCIAFMEKECKVERIPICDEWLALLNEAKSAPAGIAAPSPAGEANEQAITGTDEGSKLQEQGFSGKLVAHENMVTQTADWHSEYGPGHHQSYCDVCRDHPDNTWCKFRCAKKAVPTPKPKSWCGSSCILAVILVATALACFCRSLRSG